jgi:retron-type reverse transcriptase
MDHPPVELFQQTSEIATLRAAWTKVLANAGAAGGDGVTVERFALVADAQLELLQRELRNGKYRPGPARRVYIPKPNGGVRPLDIPCVCDRIVQGTSDAEPRG